MLGFWADDGREDHDSFLALSQKAPESISGNKADIEADPW